MKDNGLGAFRPGYHKDERRRIEWVPLQKNDVVEAMKQFLWDQGIDLEEHLPLSSALGFHKRGTITVPPASEGGLLLGGLGRPIKLIRVDFNPIDLWTQNNVTMRQLFKGVNYNIAGMVQGASSVPAGVITEWVWNDNFLLKEQESVDFIFTNPGPNPGNILFQIEGWAI